MSKTVIHTGWGRFSFDTHRSIASRFRELAREDVPYRGGAMKLAGTAALSLWIGLPQSIREGLIEWASRVEKDPELAKSPEQTAIVLTSLIKAMLETTPTNPVQSQEPPGTETWFVDRILDPAVLKRVREHARQSKAG